MSWNIEPICTFMSNWLIRLKIFASELIESPRLMKNWLIELLLLNWWTACFGILINVSLVVIQVQKEQSPCLGWAMANLSLAGNYSSKSLMRPELPTSRHLMTTTLHDTAQQSVTNYAVERQLKYQYMNVPQQSNNLQQDGPTKRDVRLEPTWDQSDQFS